MQKHLFLIVLSLIFIAPFTGIAQDEQLIKLNYQFPKIYEIANITVTGTKTLNHSTLISFSGLKQGDEIAIPGDDISNAIKKIWKQDLVGDIQIHVTKVIGKDVYLNIHVTEIPRLSQYVINNNIDYKSLKKDCQLDCKAQFRKDHAQKKACLDNCNTTYDKKIAKKKKKDYPKIKSTDLDEIDDLINLHRGKRVTSSFKKNTELAIERFYKEKGFYNATANAIPEEDTLLDNSVILNITIDPGKKVKIKNVIFNGNNAVPDKKLKKKMKNTKEKKITRIFSRSKYIQEEALADLEKVKTYYNSLGFRDAKVELNRVYSISDKLVNVEIDIDEGQKYYFRNIEWKGNFIYDDSTLNRIVSIKKGDIYNKSLLDQKLNYNPTGPDVSSLYLDNGYLFFSVVPVEVNVVGDSIDLEMRIHEGAQARINQVTVSGNTKTSDHVIIREIRDLPGNKFSRSTLIRTQRELAALGYFEPEQIGINPVPNPADGTVDIHYTVVEKPSDQLQLSGGWGGAVGFIGTLGLVFNNFSLRNFFHFNQWNPLPSGDGQRLSLRFQANGREFQTYSLSVTEPWLGGKKPVSLTVSLSHSVRNTFDRITRDRIGFLKVSGLTVNFGRRLKVPDDWFTLSYGASFLLYDIEDYPSPICETCNARNFALTGTLARNNIGTNPQFPTEGANVSLSVTATPPYSLMNRSRENLPEPDRYDWIEYHKWYFDMSWFMKLTHNKRQRDNLFGESKTQRPLVMNVRTHLGFIGSYNKNYGIGPFERFILGGDGLSGAGFGSFILGQDIIGLRGYSNNSIVPVDEGGIIFNKFVAELRYPLVTQGVATVFLLGFLEAGNNWASYQSYNPFDLYKSYGMGLRIFMPAFGMIGIDYGIGIDNVPGDPSAGGGQFHFIIGQQLR